ncbi:hypothetical protein BTUL_0247g00170 [Botrytis tulipae]|uniref:Uncharacterized protein n=1 Tax=Botrytis tulipae TaxID=87230 RepID=A0A4Z1EB26_9HELO|nr:hypothetical protein BTUL_0247g00170 [Botrytis tulipae]
MIMDMLRKVHQLSPSHNDSSKINQNISTMFFDLVSRGGVNASTVGFLGFCLKDPSDIWLCAKSATSLANFVTESRSYDYGLRKNSRNSLCLVDYGRHDEENLADVEREVIPFPSRLSSNWALIVIVLASLLSFVSAFWQHISSGTGASMVRSLSYGTIRTVVGPAAMALAWGSVFFLFLTTFGLLLMILSIKALAETFG